MAYGISYGRPYGSYETAGPRRSPQAGLSVPKRAYQSRGGPIPREAARRHARPGIGTIGYRSYCLDQLDVLEGGVLACVPGFGFRV